FNKMGLGTQIDKKSCFHLFKGNPSVTESHKIPDKNLITPDRRDIPLLPMLEAGLDLQQAPPIDSIYQ
ncbi:MAG: hypothetical protein Q7V12_00720, partial [Deltaproteobacteria bacterium]|nr:hypothetical protein [Deltaproteobacteria bacterium]